MTLLSRDDILAANDLATEDIDVPEWGGTVRIQALTGAQRDAFEASVVKMNGQSRQYNLTNLRARFVALSVVDDEGKRLFIDADVKQLGAKSAGALQRVFNAAQKLSGMSDEDVEELAEGFGSDQSDGSTSA